MLGRGVLACCGVALVAAGATGSATKSASARRAWREPTVAEMPRLTGAALDNPPPVVACAAGSAAVTVVYGDNAPNPICGSNGNDHITLRNPNGQMQYPHQIQAYGG